ncbi:MAG: DUF1285 domain-containing protein [Amphritea sp.]
MSKSKFDLKQVSQHIPPVGDARKLPPVHLWNPDFSGDIDMRITRDGRWIHEGGEIKRAAMVTMFSTILWRESDNYFLMTPVEKVGIQVEDVPFQFIHLEVKQGSDGQELVFTTVTDDVVTASKEHPLRIEIDPVTGEPSPYLMVRYGMEGRLSRNLYYELVELAVEQEGRYIVTSCGESFELG